MPKTPKKPQTQVYKDYYQRNKESERAKRKERYANQKKQEQLSVQKHYQANSIKTLLSLKKYTELNQQKKKLWLDFCWTLQDCQDEQGIKIYDIVQIQKLEQLAGNLIRDYYQTAKEKSKIKGSWNNLTSEQQSKLIKYWGTEKARKEQVLAEQLTEQEQQGQLWEKDIELTKFHEERGKIKCECWQCAKRKELQAEIKAQILNDKDKTEKEQCPECQEWFKELDKESEMCDKCLKNYEE